MIQPPVELAQTDVFAPRFGLNEVRPLVDLRGAKVKDEAWLVHVANALKQSASADGDVITRAGYNSLLVNDVSVKPPAVIGIYPLFPDKAASAEVLTSGRAQSTLNEHITSSARGMPTRSRLYRCTCSSRTHTWSIAIT